MSLGTGVRQHYFALPHIRKSLAFSGYVMLWKKNYFCDLWSGRYL